MLLDSPSNRAIIDCARAIGIVLVICFHVVVGLTAVLPVDSLPQYIAALPGALNIAWQALGSEIVFLFSGFLLAYLLLRELLQTGRIDMLDYYVRRMSRIVPLYLIGLTLYAFTTDFTLFELLLNLLFVSKLFNAKTIIPVGWSLEVLAQTFLLLPVVVLMLMRSRRPVTIVVVAIVVSVGARYVALIGDPESYRTPIYSFFAGTSTPETLRDLYYHLGYRATPFLLGFLLAYLVLHKERSLLRLFARRGAAFVLIAASVIIIVATGFLPIQDAHSMLYALTTDEFWLWFWTLQRFIFALGVCGLTLCLWYGRSRLLAPLVWIANHDLWRVIAVNIYSIYLFHPVFLIPAAVIAFRTISRDEVGDVHVLEVVATMLVATVFSVLFAMILTRFVEAPARRRIQEFYRSSRKTPINPE